MRERNGNWNLYHQGKGLYIATKFALHLLGSGRQRKDVVYSRSLEQKKLSVKKVLPRRTFVQQQASAWQWPCQLRSH